MCYLNQRSSFLRSPPASQGRPEIVDKARNAMETEKCSFSSQKRYIQQRIGVTTEDNVQQKYFTIFFPNVTQRTLLMLLAWFVCLHAGGLIS